MASRDASSPSRDDGAGPPVFKKCARCAYALHGLPARHACPECGLRYDERCALFRVKDPRRVLALWMLIMGGGWLSLKKLPRLANMGDLSAWETVGALAGVLWIVVVAVGIWYFIRRYRRGFEVAVTSDGLILRLPALSEDLIPWRDIVQATVEDRPAGKPQVASIVVGSTSKSISIGGVADVFPDRATVERFVSLVSERIGASDGELGSGSTPDA